MLHRMTTLLSTVVIAFLAAPVLNAMFSTAARAAENCLARPIGAPPDGGYWYSQTNPITRQECWMIGASKAAARNAVLPAWFSFGSSNEVAERAPAAGCIAAPNGQAPRGQHWVYRVDNATGQRCWRLGDRVSKVQVSRIKISKIGNAIPSRAPVTPVASQTQATVLSRAIADANARLVDTSVAPPRRIELSSSPAAAIAEIASENLATPTFASRWTDLSDHARSSDRAAKPVGLSEIPDDATHSTASSGHRLAVGRPLDVTLLIFLASLGGALILFGLAGRSFFFERSTPPVWPDLSPSDDVLRVADFAGASSSYSPGDGGGRGHEAANDWQIAMDALLRLGGRPMDRDPSRAQRHAAGERRLGDRRGRQSGDEDNESK